jgi:hypothetical protein
MRHYGPTLLISLFLPAFLSLMPLFGKAQGSDMLLQIVGSLVFYSFVLLPTALKFDFRRDVDRIAVFKAMPISPLAVTIGQLAAPVLLCAIFQLVVLLFALVIRPYPPVLIVVAMVILIPVNALIFSVENLIFLLFPYRVNQEGIGVFLRSILNFTAKGILFVAGLLLTLLVATVSALIAERLAIGNYPTRLLIVFASSMWCLTTGVVAMFMAILCRTYRRFDPSQDTPSMS